MRMRGFALASVFVVTAVAAGCSGPERAVVQRYFSALAQGDNQTLTSFATVRLEEAVEGYEIVSASEEVTGPVVLPGLIKEQDEIKAEMDANNQAATAYYDEHPDVDRIREIRDAAREAGEEPQIPRRLQDTDTEWMAFTEKDLELKRRLGDAEQRIARETNTTKLSVGDVSGIEDLSGQIISKTVELNLTIDGEQRSYVMTMRRYDLALPDGVRGVSRWVVDGLEPSN